MALMQATLLSAAPRTLSVRPQQAPKLTHFEPRIQSLRQRPFNFSSSWTVKCSADFNGNQAVIPKPTEISWKKELSNSVSLVGIIIVPVEVKYLESDKTVARSRLAVKKTALDTFWIDLTFWDEVAHIAFEHVKKGQEVYVSGQLVSDTVYNQNGTQKVYYKVVVQKLNFVERSSSPASPDDGENSSMTSDERTGNSNGKDATGGLWQAFFANPLQWRDNRNNKRTPDSPDFRHKGTGEALWVGSRNNPPWVFSQLAVLDERMGNSCKGSNAIDFHPWHSRTSDLLAYGIVINVVILKLLQILGAT